MSVKNMENITNKFYARHKTDNCDDIVEGVWLKAVQYPVDHKCIINQIDPMICNMILVSKLIFLCDWIYERGVLIIIQ